MCLFSQIQSYQIIAYSFKWTPESSSACFVQYNKTLEHWLACASLESQWSLFGGIFGYSRTRYRPNNTILHKVQLHQFKVGYLFQSLNAILEPWLYPELNQNTELGHLDNRHRIYIIYTYKYIYIYTWKECFSDFFCFFEGIPPKFHCLRPRHHLSILSAT